MFGGKDLPVLQVVTTPSQGLALTNCAFCSRGQFAQYKLPRSDYGMCRVNELLTFKVIYPFIHCSVVIRFICLSIGFLMLLSLNLSFVFAKAVSIFLDVSVIALIFPCFND